MEIEIGIGKSGRRAYGFDDIAIVPSRRTRDPEDVEITWEVDAFKFELPLMAAAMDGVVSPSTAIETGRLGGLACLNLEGLWTRYDDCDAVFDEIAQLPPEKATRRMQELYAEPIKEELIGKRIAEIKEGGVTACASLTPQRVEKYHKLVLDAELDILVIQGTVVSAEHVSKTTEPPRLDRRGGRDDAVHRRGHQRQLELEGVDLPRDLDVLGIPGPAAGHDRDVVEPVGPASRLADPDLDLHETPLHPRC